MYDAEARVPFADICCRHRSAIVAERGARQAALLERFIGDAALDALAIVARYRADGPDAARVLGGLIGRRGAAGMTIAASSRAVEAAMRQPSERLLLLS